VSARYVPLSAVSGSTRAARRAGTTHAIEATSDTTIETVAKLIASCGATP